MGSVVYERAYYHCEHCHTGIFPTDEEFGITEKLSPGATEVISLVGLLEPFEEGSHETLPRLSGLNVSASTIQRVTESVGTNVAQRRDEGELIGPETVWDWNRDAQGESVAYVGLDATGVRQQGLHGEKTEGRMPWVGTVFNPQPTQEKRRRRRVWECRYVSGLMSLQEIGAQLRRECLAVGVDQADRVNVLTDGGNGLENCMLDVLGGIAKEIVFILDFWHVSEHLQEFANLFITEEEQRRKQVQGWCHRLKHEGGAALLKDLRDLDLHSVTPIVRESHRLLTNFVVNNLHRMDYPAYVARGWQIGSGKVESACKTVVGQRLKGPGMRWRTYGTTALCQLRALYKSKPGIWNDYWKRTTVP
jgi:hypothetical protein